MERTAILKPKNLTIRFEENRLGICYAIQDDLTKAVMGETFVHFTPSEKLMELLREETNKALTK